MSGSLFRRARIELMLGLAPVEYSSWLGEDDLAEFGAYREHAASASGSDEVLP